jgi:putative transposase
MHGELLKLGFDLSERTVSRWMRPAPRRPDAGKRWRAFLNNHREVIAAMDFFTVPTLRFTVLYCFFVIAHDRRAFSIATSPGIRVVCGLRSSFEKHFRLDAGISI